MVKIKKDHWKFTGKESEYRRLSIKECAAIQTFPTDFEFVGELGSQYRLIGNAVPPLLARIIAESIKELEQKRIVVDNKKVKGKQKEDLRSAPIALVRAK
jgi:DNA (cytosine-5)-methyltransferase 1